MCFVGLPHIIFCVLSFHFFLVLSYRTLLERFLSLRLLYVRSRVSRQVSFEFMNQQIAWQALSDFMLFVLPLINFAALGRAAVWMGRTVGLLAPAPSSARVRGRRAGEGQHGGGAEDQEGVVGVAEALALGCPYCGLQPACQPTVAHPCGHIFCYYCLSGNRLAEAAEQVARGRRGGAQGALPTEFACPACQRPVTAQAPLNAQLLQPGGTGAAQQQQQPVTHR
jgi:peroxin-2